MEQDHHPRVLQQFRRASCVRGGAGSLRGRTNLLPTSARVNCEATLVWAGDEVQAPFEHRWIARLSPSSCGGHRAVPAYPGADSDVPRYPPLLQVRLSCRLQTHHQGPGLSISAEPQSVLALFYPLMAQSWVIRGISHRSDNVGARVRCWCWCGWGGPASSSACPGYSEYCAATTCTHADSTALETVETRVMATIRG